MNNRIIRHLQTSLGLFFEKIADILLPKERRVRLLERLGPDGLFENIPRADNFDFETGKIKAMFDYRTVLCRQAIWEIKYRANSKLIRDFSLLLYEYILEELADWEKFENFHRPTLIPIPASSAHVREKGFNQCVLIVRELMKIDRERNGNNFTVLENYLIKKTDTPHQARIKNRKNRLKNLENAFTVDKSVQADFSAKRAFIIIDDVITTGATMREAFRALTNTGLSPRQLRGFALAH